MIFFLTHGRSFIACVRNNCCLHFYLCEIGLLDPACRWPTQHPIQVAHLHSVGNEITLLYHLLLYTIYRSVEPGEIVCIDPLRFI